jgi:hypothetical protein
VQAIAESSTLRYLEAAKVQSPVGDLAQVDLRDRDDEKIGNVEGVLVDPAERRLRFFVIQSPGWFRKRRYLLPTEWPAQVDAAGRLRVDVDSDTLACCEEFERASVPEYGDEDLLNALFRRRIA